MRLIDAEALREKLYEWCGNHCENKDGCKFCDISDIIDFIYEAPTIEAKPVVHAHWECTQWYEHQCSNCGDFALLNDKNVDCKSNYCPHCGAVMDEVIDNDKRQKKA